MNKFSKFLRDKNTVTIIGVLLCLVILSVGYTMRINKKTKLVEVYYAKETIQPKTKITEEMVAKTSVPVSFIKGEYYNDYNDITSKYSNYNTMIAQGSLFYKDLLVNEADLPDSILLNIDEDTRLVMFPVDMVTTYGNSMMPSNVIDIYVKLYDKNEKLIYGEFLESIEILAVKDAAGKNVFENTEENRIPAYIYFSLPEAKYLLFSALNFIKDDGYYEKRNQIEIVLVPKTIKFNPENGTEVTSDYLYDFIVEQIKKIDGQEELYNKLINEIEQMKLEKKKKEKELLKNQDKDKSLDKDKNLNKDKNKVQPENKR